MLKPNNITMLKMMLTGYISAETYRALSSKKHYSDLSLEECFDYDSNVCIELRNILLNSKVINQLALLEQAEICMHDNSIEIYDILLTSVEQSTKSTEEIKQLIQKIGYELFVSDYIFCTDDCLLSLYYISEDNISEIKNVRDNFIANFNEFLNNRHNMATTHMTPEGQYEIAPDTYSSIVSEPFGDYNIASGEGFNYDNTFIIDDDALASDKKDCKKYVLFLYSLNATDFEKFEEFVKDLMYDCSVRLCNSVRALGIRNFLTNYLFANDIKCFQIKNFGRKSLHELIQIKPKIINYIINAYENKDTSKIETELNHQAELAKQVQLTLKEKIGEQQYLLLEKELHSLLVNASVRTRNGITNYKGDFIEDFVHRNKDVKSIEHIGRKSEIEIEKITLALREMIEGMKGRELSQEDKAWIEKTAVYDSYLDIYCRNYFDGHGRLPMFHILESCFTNYGHDRYLDILNGVLPFFDTTTGKSMRPVRLKIIAFKQ